MSGGAPNDLHQIGPGAEYLDISPYSAPTKGTYGNIGVGTERGPGMSRFDLSFSKQFHFTERRFFELRAEAFNLTNTPIFQSPASQTITSTLFGQIRSSRKRAQHRARREVLFLARNEAATK